MFASFILSQNSSTNSFIRNFLIEWQTQYSIYFYKITIESDNRIVYKYPLA